MGVVLQRVDWSTDPRSIRYQSKRVPGTKISSPVEGSPTTVLERVNMRYSEKPSVYLHSKRALAEFLRQQSRSMLDVRKGQRKFDQWSRERVRWDGNRCGLCRMVQKSAKSFSADSRGICLSCSMRGNRPRWLDVAGGMVAKWRGPLLQRQFAAQARMKRPMMARLESSSTSRVNCGTARKLANAVVLSTNLGNDLRAVMETWPLFPLLADPNVIEGFMRGQERIELIESALGPTDEPKLVWDDSTSSFERTDPTPYDEEPGDVGEA